MAGMIRIQVNSEDRQIPDGTSMAQLIEMLDLGDRRIAVEVNAELVPRSTFEGHLLTDKDKVEIIQAIGGG
jgi:sulfur carrier protein